MRGDAVFSQCMMTHPRQRTQQCRICEFPALDTAVPAARFPKCKLSEWWLQKLNAELDDDGLDTAQICQFCIWDARLEDEHAEKLKNSGDTDWWKGFDTNPVYFENYYKNEKNMQPSKVQLIKVDVVPKETNEAVEHENSTSAESSDKTLVKTKWSCIYCDNSTITYNCKQSLYYHFKKSHPGEVIKCQYNRKCAKLFKTNEEREVHVKAFHENANGRKKRSCIYCKKLVYFDHFYRHMRNHHKAVAIRCDFIKTCPTYFESQIEKKRHIQEKHFVDPAQQLKCIYCKVSFSSKPTLSHHVNRKHDDTKIKCIVSGCVTYFFTLSGRDDHYEKEHQVDKNSRILQCPQCPYRATRKDHLKHHVDRIHQSKQLNCLKCSKIFASERSLKNHLYLVHRKRKICKFCKKSVLRLGVHLRNIFCEHCKKAISCKGLRIKHNKHCCAWRLRKEIAAL